MPNISDQYLQIVIILLMEEIQKPVKVGSFSNYLKVLYNPGGWPDFFHPQTRFFASIFHHLATAFENPYDIPYG